LRWNFVGRLARHRQPHRQRAVVVRCQSVQLSVQSARQCGRGGGRRQRRGARGRSAAAWLCRGVGYGADGATAVDATHAVVRRARLQLCPPQGREVRLRNGSDGRELRAVRACRGDCLRRRRVLLHTYPRAGARGGVWQPGERREPRLCVVHVVVHNPLLLWRGAECAVVYGGANELVKRRRCGQRDRHLRGAFDVLTAGVLFDGSGCAGDGIGQRRYHERVARLVQLCAIQRVQLRQHLPYARLVRARVLAHGITCARP
jgi:hypothetical protein